MSIFLTILNSVIKWSCKILVLFFKISFALIKLAIGLTFLIFSLGMAASRTSNY